ncbi:MAG TPA: protein kinase [Vicinamibacterales bacterium]|jgi:Tol biopolymer transport system component
MADHTGYLTGMTLGRFRVGPLLGRGGMGEVYRAEDSELGRSVALKVLLQSLLGDEERLSRFIQEARTASALNHPHIVAVYDIGRQAPTGATAGARPVQYVAMELVSGSSLRDAIDGRRLDLKRTLDYLAQAADALAAAHAAGIVHRDLKPENLMIAEGGYTKVLDFGLAKLQAQPATLEAGTATMAAGTSPGMVMGTVGYMSPEQAEGRPVDQRSDIFSFGCILYETATGTRAFSGTSAVDTLHRIIHEQPEPVTARMPGAPSELQRIIRKCLAKDPDDRYQSMKEVAIDLRDLRRQLDSGAIAAPAAVAPAHRSMAAPLAVAVAALIIAGGSAAYWLGHRAGPAPGAQVQMTRVTQSGNVIDAAVSPDGKYFAYVEAVEGRQGLWYRQMNGSRALELVPGARVGFWGIAFSRDGTSIYYALKSNEATTGGLYVIPALGGTPRLLLSGIDSAISLSPDGSHLVYLRSDYPATGSSAVMVAAADGSGARELASVRAPELFAPGFFAAPSWSPDGARVAATVRNGKTRDARLVTIDAGSGAVTDMPGRYRDATFTEWLPDGSGIVFIAQRLNAAPGLGGQVIIQPYPSGAIQWITHDYSDYRVAHVTADGGSILAVGFDATVAIWIAPLADPAAARKLPSVIADGRYGIAWSADGRRLYFGGAARDHREIWSMAPDGSDRQQLPVDGQSIQPAASPDGTFIAFVGDRGGEAGIWRAKPAGNDARLLTQVSDPSYLTMSPDGRWVYFTSSMSGVSSTWRVAATGGAPALISPGLERAAVSPDGRLLAGLYVASPTAPLALGILPADGGPPTQTFPGFAQATASGSIGWAADGQSVLYTNVERLNVWRQRLAGGAPEKVTNYSDLMIFRFVLSRDGRQLALVRGTQTRDAVLISNFR